MMETKTPSFLEEMLDIPPANSGWAADQTSPATEHPACRPIYRIFPPLPPRRPRYGSSANVDPGETLDRRPGRRSATNVSPPRPREDPPRDHRGAAPWYSRELLVTFARLYVDTAKIRAPSRTAPQSTITEAFFAAAHSLASTRQWAS